jgi:hypothetical protein
MSWERRNDSYPHPYEAAYTRVRATLQGMPDKAPRPPVVRSHGGSYRLQSGYPFGYPVLAVIFIGAAALLAIAAIRSWWKGGS